MRLRGVVDRRCGRARAGVACGAVALLAALAASGPSPAVAAVPADSAGIYSEELERANSADPVAAGVAQRAAGIGIVRQTFSWARIETAPNVLDFTVYDEVMGAAALAGVAVLPVLMDPPSWRSTAPATGALDDMYPPREPAAMAVLAGLLVQRYGPAGTFWAARPELPRSPVRSWQVWNEPNTPNFWAPAPDPAGYTELLRAVSAAIHAADPAAEVVTAGLPASDHGIGLREFLDAMYDAGARGTFDTLAIHPYASDAATVLGVLQVARDVADRRGDAQRPIWATEFGWATGGPPVTISATEDEQATLLRDAIVLMQRARAALELRGFIVFRWRDVPLNPGQLDFWPFHAGLLRVDGTRKPSLQAFSDAVAVWRREPTLEQAAAAAATAEAAAAALTQGASAPGFISRPPVPGVTARRLRIGRYVSRGRLFVRVTVPPGGRGQRVRISYRALRGTRVLAGDVREVTTRKGVARVVFTLTRASRTATRLRITATQGTARATRELRLKRRAAVSRPSAG